MISHISFYGLSGSDHQWPRRAALKVELMLSLVGCLEIGSLSTRRDALKT